jgi:hypothetical protein
MLSGVVRIERVSDGIMLVREHDQPAILIGHDTAFGDTLLNGIDKATNKAGIKFGDPAAAFIAKIHGLSVDGSTIKIDQSGPATIPITIEQKQDKHYWIKAVKLEDISFTVERDQTKSCITNITGVTLMLDAFNLPIEFREFARWKDSDGHNIYSIGIKNPMPHPLISLFGLNEVLHLEFTESSKKDLPLETAGFEEFNNSIHINKPPDQPGEASLRSENGRGDALHGPAFENGRGDALHGPAFENGRGDALHGPAFENGRGDAMHGPAFENGRGDAMHRPAPEQTAIEQSAKSDLPREQHSIPAQSINEQPSISGPQEPRSRELKGDRTD